MKIKKIEILGFKSFYDKTVLHINEPITAVVGPNGCGKSNIIDAIRWCMGEQSAKHLRGGKMEDVIFAGSETRSAAGLAEVSLTFENVGLSISSQQEQRAQAVEAPLEEPTFDADAIPLEEAEPTDNEILGDDAPRIDFSQYGEVTVTRRLFRDGASDYFINKAPCRLRDIIDFFLGTGVGTKAYSIIEQGRVGMIVSAKPEDRRLIIEEAAGITKFKKKKQAAERKMDQTRQNLVRVGDVVAELEKQLGTLRRQAQKAERYKKYRAEVRDIELWSASHRLLGLRAESQHLTAALADVVERRDRAHAEVETREAAIVAARAELAVEERQLAELTQTVFDLENRVKLGESQVDYQNREAKDLEERIASSHGEIDGVRRQIEEAGLELGLVRERAAALETEGATRQAELTRLEEEQRRAREELGIAQGELDGARGEISKAQQEIARFENQARGLERRRGELETRSIRMREEETRIATRAEELRLEIGTHEDKLGELKQLKLDLAQQKGALESRLNELKEQQAKTDAEVDTLRGESHRRRSRLKALKDIEAKYEGFARGTRAVMQHRAQLAKGLLADRIAADPELEPAVEAVLGDRLGAILVESHANGLEAIDFLKKGGGGKATFMLPSATDCDVAAVESMEGVRGPLVDFVKCAPELRGLFGDVVVVDSLARAVALWDGGFRRAMVTLEGDLVDQHGAVTGGSKDGAGASVLSQKREIRELEELVEKLESELATATATQLSTKNELGAVSATLDALRKDSHQGEITILSSEKDLARGRSEAAEIARRSSNLEKDRLELDGALAECAREAEENTIALGAARLRADESERRQLGLIEGVTMARGAVDDALAQVTACKIRVAEVSSERQGVRTQGQRLEDAGKELTRRVEKLEQTISEGTTRVTELRASSTEMARDLVGLREERRTVAEELALGRRDHEERMANEQVAELETRNLRTDADKLASQANKLEVKLADASGAERHVIEAIAEKYRVELVKELFDHHLRPPVGEVEEARLRELRDLIERMGEINLTAIEECEELTKRYDFLTTQKADLESALDQLEKAIAKINKTSRKRFRETFDLVNKKFQEIFPRLFRGGNASLRLTNLDGKEGDDDAILDAGVEITAQPPGKKNATIELLSGGEKAMTAVALIFSIFLIKPSPFCILDEVDAPLDEANVGRYNEIVREMTDRSQFIVITHNKRTMEIADSLYGITMEEPGCSKLVNVNLRQLDVDHRPEKRAA